MNSIYGIATIIFAAFYKSKRFIERASPGGDGTEFKHTLDFSAVEKLNVLSACVYLRFMFPQPDDYDKRFCM